MSSVFVWFCVEVGGVGGAGAAASHLAALDPISLALLAPQVIAAAAERDDTTGPSHPASLLFHTHDRHTFSTVSHS